MADQPKDEQFKQIQVNTSDEMSRGRYSNNMILLYSAEEFILDWFLNAPSGVHLVSRIIVSPGHIKRIMNVLKQNLDNYEKQYGSIKELEATDSKFH
jgi:hypothetical protein